MTDPEPATTESPGPLARRRLRAGPTASVVALIAAGLLIGAGWPSISGGFYLDSEGFSRWLPQLEDTSFSWSRIQDLLLTNPFPGATRRVLSNFTFVLESYVVGFTPRSARLINLFLHGLNVGILFLLSRRILSRVGMAAGRATLAASLAGIFWGLNPFHADTVFYAVQRMTLLSSSFYLLGALSFLRARGARGPRRWAWWGVVGVCYVAGLASKENAILLPLSLGLLEWLLPGASTSRDPSRDWRKRIIGVAAVLLVPLVTAVALGFDPISGPKSFLAARGREFTLASRLLTEGRVLLHYLSLFFLPLPQRLTFVLKYRLSQSLLSPLSTLASWGAITGLVALAVVQRKRWPLFSLGVLWFFINHLLESTVIPLEIAFIHRNYLPSVFLLLPLVASLTDRFAIRRPAVGLAVVSVALLLLLGWHDRAQVWGQPAAFWQDASQKAPGSLRAFINLGVLHDIEGRPGAALEVYRRGELSAFEETPAAWSSLYCCMGIAEMNLQRYDRAEQYMDKALGLAPLPDCLINLAKLHLLLGDPGQASAALDRLTRLRPTHRKLHLMRARVLLLQGHLEAAWTELQEELRIFPGNREAQQLLTEINRLRQLGAE